MALTIRLTPDEQEKLEYLMHKAAATTASGYFKSLMFEDEPIRQMVTDQASRILYLESENHMFRIKIANLKTAFSDIFSPSE